MKVTAYDRTLLEVSIDGLIRSELLDAHMKSESLKKRIKTLKQGGFKKENRLTDDRFRQLYPMPVELKGKSIGRSYQVRTLSGV